MDNKQELVGTEKVQTETSEKYLKDTDSVEEDKKSEELHTHGGDTAFANAPWKFKVIALCTALLFPCKYTQ
jgi:hypothetical protein